MPKKSTLVEDQFSKYNCAQTVFSLFAKDLGLEETTALKIASGFGGGMACAETCGAVTGAYMVIGMKYGNFKPYDFEGKANTKAFVRRFNEQFKKIHGSLVCKELTGFDISTSEGNVAAKEANVYSLKCTKFIQTACDILEEKF